MPGYWLTPQARTGFQNIVDCVEDRFGARAAERVLDRLLDTFERLAESPGIGQHREDLTSDDRIRFWSVGPTLIAYRSVGDSIQILIIERGERDWEQLMKREE